MKVHYKEDRIVVECHCGRELHLAHWLFWGSETVHVRKTLRCGHVFDGIIKRDMKHFPLTPFEKARKRMEMGI